MTLPAFDTTQLAGFPITIRNTLLRRHETLGFANQPVFQAMVRSKSHATPECRKYVLHVLGVQFASRVADCRFIVLTVPIRKVSAGVKVRTRVSFLRVRGLHPYCVLQCMSSWTPHGRHVRRCAQINEVITLTRESPDTGFPVFNPISWCNTCCRQETKRGFPHAHDCHLQ